MKNRNQNQSSIEVSDGEVETGDIVQLVSGGPKMTVLGVVKGSVKCGWFTKGGEYQQQAFAPNLLKTGTGTLPFMDLAQLSSKDPRTSKKS